MYFVDFSGKFVCNTNSRISEIAYKGPYIFLILIKAEFHDNCPWILGVHPVLSCCHSMNTLKYRPHNHLESSSSFFNIIRTSSLVF